MLHITGVHYYFNVRTREAADAMAIRSAVRHHLHYREELLRDAERIIGCLGGPRTKRCYCDQAPPRGEMPFQWK